MILSISVLHRIFITHVWDNSPRGIQNYQHFHKHTNLMSVEKKGVKDNCTLKNKIYVDSYYPQNLLKVWLLSVTIICIHLYLWWLLPLGTPIKKVAIEKVSTYSCPDMPPLHNPCNYTNNADSWTCLWWSCLSIYLLLYLLVFQ